MYNRYLQERQGGEERARETRRPPHPTPPPGPGTRESPAGTVSAGLKGLLRGVLGNRMEPGDLLLYSVLLLLYLEQEDEELLIVLAALVVLGFSDQESASGSRKT